MKLQVTVFEARELACKGSGDSVDPYVKLQLGKVVSNTAVIHGTLSPAFDEEFAFRVDDVQAELVITVCDRSSCLDDFLGRVTVPVSKVLHAEKLTIAPSWYPLQQRSSKSKKRVSGEILLSFSLYGSSSTVLNNAVNGATIGTLPVLPLVKVNSGPPADADTAAGPTSALVNGTESPLVNGTASPLVNVTGKFKSSEGDGSPRTPITSDSSSDAKRPTSSSKKKLRHTFSALFKKSNKLRVHPSNTNTADLSPPMSVYEDGDTTDEEHETLLSFDDDDILFVPTDEGIPAPLPSGVLLDQTYATSAKSLNSVLFKPASPFFKDLMSVQRNTETEEAPWKRTGNEAPTRIVSYMKAPSRLVKSVRATEEQTYVKADDKAYVVLSSVNTPDVPYGTNFKTEVQYCITPVSENCRLRISWRMNFLHSLLAKGLVENGAKQGLRESFGHFSEVLSKYVKPVVEDEDDGSSKILPDLEAPKSDWELFVEYVQKPVVIFTAVLAVLMFLHVFLAAPNKRSGLEVWELDLPDSLSEIVAAAILVLHLEKILKIGLKFLRARVCVGGDHGIRAKGEGWMLTVTLVEAENLPRTDVTSCLDPYVVFTCSGKTRTSSVKLQTTQPKWTEIFEFDATDDPPSTLELEVFDYDGPFPEAESLGCAEINFLKHTSTELADIWIKLDGRLAKASGSRVHLRIFLTNTKESDVFVDYVKKVEKEVGSKIVKISAQRNTSFQKLFSVPAEEFLINDFACAIKRKIPLQGRMFLSPRMLGFYSNIFGHKTKFAILWEDIEEVQELSPSLANVGPSLVVFTRRGRAHDSNQGAKSVDSKGRLKFQFQSFVRPGPAFRTLSVLWKNRTLTPEQQIRIVETQNLFSAEVQSDNGDFLGVEEANLTEVYTTEMPFTTASLRLLYARENIEEKIMEKAGCANYTVSPWEGVNGKHLVQQRQVNYKFNRRLCQFGSAVSGVQQMETSPDQMRISVHSILTLHDVPFGDNFQIHVKKDIETLTTRPPRAQCRVYVGLAWQKGTTLQKRITCNVLEQFTKHLKEELDITAKAILSFKDHRAYVLV